MSMREWAREQVAKACKKENPNWNGKSFDYGCACYQVALKAYEKVLDAKLSGMAHGFVTGILNRLMKGLPLVAIEDKPENWNECGYVIEDGVKVYQSRDMYSLFKNVYPDGNVRYSDPRRVRLLEVGNKYYCYGGLSRIVEKIKGCEIKMPYYPSDKPFVVYHECCEVGGKDYYYIHWVRNPNGDIVLKDIAYIFNDESKDWEVIGNDVYKEKREEAERTGQYTSQNRAQK